MLIPPIPIANYGAILAAEQLLKEVKPYAPVAFDSGRETWFEGAGVFVCTDGQAWTQIWDRHVKNEAIGRQRIGNLTPAPSFDFGKNIVVAVFGGPTRGVVGYRAVNGYEFGKQAFLRLVPVAVPSGTNNVALPSPWAFLALPRTRATVSIQMPRGNAWATVAQVKPTL